MIETVNLIVLVATAILGVFNLISLFRIMLAIKFIRLYNQSTLDLIARFVEAKEKRENAPSTDVTAP